MMHDYQPSCIAGVLVSSASGGLLCCINSVRLFHTMNIHATVLTRGMDQAISKYK